MPKVSVRWRRRLCREQGGGDGPRPRHGARSRGEGITVNVVQPGPIETDMNPGDTEFADAMRSLLAIKRYGRPEEIAGAVAYLAAPEAAYVTGIALSVDGGFLT